MKFSTSFLAAAAPFLVASQDFETQSGSSRMGRLMAMKTESHERQRALGLLDPGRYTQLPNEYTPCENGRSGEYQCNGIDMAGFLSHETLGSLTREGNDVWGWTSADGREFGAVGQTDGTSFVEILEDGSLQAMGRLPTQTTSAIWRDMKVIGDHVYIGSEAQGHGLQVFDMRRLLEVDPANPPTFSILTDLTSWFPGFGNSHNIVAHPETNMIYAVGATSSLTCRGGLFMVDVSDPAHPTSPGCAAADGYVHDAQCVTYTGPDAQYSGREVCFGYNEDTLTIYDVTDKANPAILSRSPYGGAAYTHQGWLVDEVGMSFLLLDDELDEQEQSGDAANQRTTTHIWNITSLTEPFKTGVYQSPVVAIDHNQYVIDGVSYMANYASGLRVVDVSSFEQDPTGGSMRELAFFDVYPEDDEAPVAEFFGTWSVYPYFQSGFLLVNSIERGIFSLRMT